MTILLWATHDETQVCNVTQFVWTTMFLDGISVIKKKKKLALHSFELMHHYPGYCICIRSNYTLSSSFYRQSNGWHGTTRQLCELYFLNDLYSLRNCLLCFLPVNWALINWSIDWAIDGSIESKRFGWKKSYTFKK